MKVGKQRRNSPFPRGRWRGAKRSTPISGEADRRFLVKLPPLAFQEVSWSSIAQPRTLAVRKLRTEGCSVFELYAVKTFKETAAVAKTLGWEASRRQAPGDQTLNRSRIKAA